MLELFDKDFKAGIVKMCQQAIMKILETTEKNRQKTESLSKEIQYVKRTKWKLRN